MGAQKEFQKRDVIRKESHDPQEADSSFQVPQPFARSHVLMHRLKFERTCVHREQHQHSAWEADEPVKPL